MSKNITPEKLQTWMREDDVLLVDVRRPDEFTRGHIPEAINIPQEAITHGVLSAIDGDKIVLYCNTGNRSSDARREVNNSCDVEVFNLAGGIERWKKAGGDSIKNQGAPLPLQRQVQITVSLLILAGFGLGFFWRPELYLISAISGFGLLNAGLTGWCGMAKLLSKAAWNK